MQMATETGKTGFKCLYLPGLFLLALVIALLCLKYGDDKIILMTNHKVDKEDKIEYDEVKIAQEEESQGGEGEGEVVPNKLNAGCNLFSGKWVYDDKSYPLYKESECSFLEEEFSCEKYGRADLKYQNWRWQPRRCDLPRFNGTTLLEKIRGKRIIFVGDSLNRNQWRSMLCLIESSLPRSSSKSIIKTGNLFFFHADDYNVTIGFYWSPFLVESNNDDPIFHREKRVVRLHGIEKHARHWNDADILIFDSFRWWLKPNMTILFGSFVSPEDATYSSGEMKRRLYKMGLNTWSQWLEININRTKTKLFFMSVSPWHETDENLKLDKNCYSETELIFNEGYWGRYTDRRMMEIAESAIRKLQTRGVKVEYMNITQMSEYRKDAHPSIYKKLDYNLTEEQLTNPKSYSDCAHWCLPGLPDVWNEILYAYIINS